MVIWKTPTWFIDSWISGEIKMELNEIQKRVVEILNNHITHDIEDNQYDKNVADELDSLDDVEITMALEDEFSLEIPDEDWEESFQDKPLTVNAVAEFIKNKLS